MRHFLQVLRRRVHGALADGPWVGIGWLVMIFGRGRQDVLLYNSTLVYFTVIDGWCQGEYFASGGIHSGAKTRRAQRRKEFNSGFWAKKCTARKRQHDTPFFSRVAASEFSPRRKPWGWVVTSIQTRGVDGIGIRSGDAVRECFRPYAAFMRASVVPWRAPWARVCRRSTAYKRGVGVGSRGRWWQG